MSALQQLVAPFFEGLKLEILALVYPCLWRQCLLKGTDKSLKCDLYLSQIPKNTAPFFPLAGGLALQMDAMVWGA